MDYLVLLSPQEICDRIRARVDPDPFGLGVLGDRQILGAVGDDSFRLRVRSGFTNSFAPCLRGLIRSASEGTRISTRFTFHPWTNGFLMVAAAGMIGAAFAGAQGSDLAIRLLLAAGALGLLFGFAALCRRVSAYDEVTLDGFMEKLVGDVCVTQG
jgi:hypothetical protein